MFIRGIGWETTSEKLRTIFSAYGELEEAIVITDKVTTKLKGYEFVTFKHIDGAMLVVKEPSKKINGRVKVAQLAAQNYVSELSSAILD
ncbi:UBP1-associated protein 2C-like protein [Tanacetum coccineum]|uniref:UBP1-associated protein 2C-like protein n=1 Tax=Tanacetum coccineum TaxID=301880 RepID=A0ABQ5EQ91_9ASTR